MTQHKKLFKISLNFTKLFVFFTSLARLSVYILNNNHIEINFKTDLRC